jgi:hypothetical protein
MTEIEIPDGFTRWDGGDCPVDKETTVRCICVDGQQFTAKAKAVAWWLPRLGCDIEVAGYRIVP